MNILEINNLSKSYDNGKYYAVNDISFELKKGNITAIVGESGSGKTTLIRLIAGLEQVDNGIISINNKEVSSITKNISPQNRNIGMVFQEYALFPHLTVNENITYSLKNNNDERLKELLDLIGLPKLGNRYPYQLSGGQQQRIALARSLAPNPELLLLDEPFSNLDSNLKVQLRKEIQDIVKQTGVTAIFITHDIQDAIAIADEMIILNEGKLIQKGTVKEIYMNPKTDYVQSIFENLVKASQLTLKSLKD